MVVIEKLQIGNIPSLVIVNKAYINEPLPTLIYYHGFGSGKENNLTISYLLAEHNYRVILPECEHHGERLQITPEERDLVFWDIVLQSIAELEQIKDYLNDNDLLLDERIGVAGTSMGGMITAGSLVKYDWIKCAGLLMSTGKLTSFAKLLINRYNENKEQQISEEEQNRVLTQLAPYDLYEHINKLNSRSLFMWHGKDDRIIPFSHAQSLFSRITEKNLAVNDVKMKEEKNRGHHLSRFAILEAVDYFTLHL